MTASCRHYCFKLKERLILLMDIFMVDIVIVVLTSHSIITFTFRFDYR